MSVIPDIISTPSNMYFLYLWYNEPHLTIKWYGILCDADTSLNIVDNKVLVFVPDTFVFCLVTLTTTFLTLSDNSINGKEFNKRYAEPTYFP